MLTRYREYQFWTNHIIVSNLMNTDKLSAEVVKSVIYHEYTHQIHKEHNKKFDSRMKLFPGYSGYKKERDAYFSSISKLPDAQVTNIKIDAADEIAFCIFHVEPDN
jgi:hypothetical protein